MRVLKLEVMSPMYPLFLREKRERHTYDHCCLKIIQIGGEGGGIHGKMSFLHVIATARKMGQVKGMSRCFLLPMWKLS